MWVQNLAFPLTSCVTLHGLLNLSVLQFSLLENGDNQSSTSWNIESS